ncbi:hypothetical protein HaLaN_11385 [Haematococcus lacustris]|uniref:Uncharacterized protein n=1 Tax=Haematococcus lacustris TaxID=44745 RepID=A0A699Z066_HAELA|nr:hypothetical protein HaLaN_11385 [Haematococcus lacustris]
MLHDALASVEGMLARCSSGATSELTQEDVLLLLHTKLTSNDARVVQASLLHQLTDKAVQADVHMS